MLASTSTACIGVTRLARGAHAARRQAASPSRAKVSLPRRFGGAHALSRLGTTRHHALGDRVVAASGDGDDSGAPEKPARRVRKLPRRSPPRPREASEASASAAAADDDDDADDADDDEDAPVVFDMRELYGDDFDPDDVEDDEDEEDEEDTVEEDEDEDEEDTEEALRVVKDLGTSLLKGDPEGHKSGYVAIVGRPNAGKSTLMNDLVGTKLSVVTHKPQTTRHRILGIVSEDEYQMVLLDTPGVMREEFNKLDELMLTSVRNAMANADVMLCIVDASRDPVGNFQGLLPDDLNHRAPLGVILNKCDLLELDEIKNLKRVFETFPNVQKVFPVSALAHVGTDAPKRWCVERLPLGPTLYPKETISEHPERFFIAEIIREKIFLQYQQEIPYSTQVWVQSHKERDGVKKDLILAKVFVERKSQMGIIIGAGGKALKKLSTAARLDIEKFLGRPVYLDLGVKVREGWRSDDAALEDLGLDDPNRLEQPNLGPAPDIVG
jgi:GTP-binding protein Era